MNKLIIPFILIFSIFGAVLTSCSDDEPKDKVKEITMYVSSETGFMYGLFDTYGEYPIECMLVMTEDDRSDWSPLSFQGIQGFSYERGHEYELRVKRTIMANPPADGSDRYYELVRIVSDILVTEPEVSVDENIVSEEDIEYYEGCPIEKYSINPLYYVDDNGMITYADGSSVPSYDNARIWYENIMDKTDSNWIDYQKIPYQATYTYVFPPLNEKVRLVRSDSHGPLFSEVVTEEEFDYVVNTMKSEEEVKYTLILANVYKKGIQRLELTIKKK